jgi:hypothetical protein
MFYRFFVCILGLLVNMLLFTGIYIWLKTRNARHISQDKRTLIEKEFIA